MYRTKHFQDRSNQRGIKQVLVNCVLDFGKIKQNKYYIDQTMAKHFILCIKQELKQRKH